MSPYATVDEYIAAQPAQVQPKLHEIRKAIRAAAPQAEEGFGYGMPVYKQEGVLIYFAATKNHLSLFPTPSALEAFKEELAQYSTSKGTIRLPLDAPVPTDLITKLVHFKLKENKAKKGR